MKGKKGQGASIASIAVTGVIAIIIGVAFIPVLSSLIDQAQVLQVIDNEQLTNTAANTTFILANLKVSVGSLTVLNSTCTETPNTGLNCTLRDDLEYILDERSSNLKIINRTGTWNVSYSFEPTTFVESATGRTVVRQVTLMYAVFLIIITLSVIGINVFRNK